MILFPSFAILLRYDKWIRYMSIADWYQFSYELCKFFIIACKFVFQARFTWFIQVCFLWTLLQHHIIPLFSLSSILYCFLYVIISKRHFLSSKFYCTIIAQFSKCSYVYGPKFQHTHTMQNRNEWCEISYRLKHYDITFIMVMAIFWTLIKIRLRLIYMHISVAYKIFVVASCTMILILHCFLVYMNIM